MCLSRPAPGGQARGFQKRQIAVVLLTTAIIPQGGTHFHFIFLKDFLRDSREGEGGLEEVPVDGQVKLTPLELGQAPGDGEA